jgi:hypothetical protein
VVVVYNGRWARHLSFLNERKSNNHRILLRLVGKKSNHSAIGARVNITAGKLAQIYEAREGVLICLRTISSFTSVLAGRR